MKKSQLDHVLRAARRITGEAEFITIGSQSLHASCPDLPDTILMSIEVDLIAKNERDRTEWLNIFGADSPFHESFGYYADPVDETTAVVPRGWKDRLVRLGPGDTDGAIGLCLDPHDLALSKYAARREKDVAFNRELARLGIVGSDKLLDLLAGMPLFRAAQECNSRLLGYRPLVPVTAAQFGDIQTREGWIRDKGMQVLQFWSDLHRETPVDMFVHEPFDFEDEYRRSLAKPLGRIEVRFATIPTLIRMKEAADRPQDRIDIAYLRKRLEDGAAS